MKNIAEMEARLTKYCWSGSGIDENYIVEMEEGLMQNNCWNGRGIE